MPIVNRVAALSDEMAAWRHDFHENPELLYEVHRTAGIVADRLREFGLHGEEVVDFAVEAQVVHDRDRLAAREHSHHSIPAADALANDALDRLVSPEK